VSEIRPAGFAELAAAVLVKLRFVVIPAALAAAVAATMYLPSLGAAKAGALGSLVPESAPAVAAQRRSAELFAFPVLSNALVVQRDPQGLTAAAHARLTRQATRINTRTDPDLLSIALALPITNALGLFPGTGEYGTTAITYLYFQPTVGLTARDRLARVYASKLRQEGDPVAGVTGVVPARVVQGRLIEDALPLVELATVLLVALVIGVNFRSPGAPILTLAAVGIAYVAALRVVALVAAELGLAAPRELEPIMLVLTLGLVTDYSIFYLSGFKHRLQLGDRRLVAAWRTTSEFTPIIVTAGLIVAIGAGSLTVAQLEFFRIFGPALALTVLVGLAVSVTFVPAVLALVGGWIFWPARPRDRPGRPSRRSVVERLTGSKLRSALVVLVVGAGLLAAASGLREATLTVNPIRSLPDGEGPARAAAVAATGFTPGIVSPTLLLVEGRDVPRRTRPLERLQTLLERQPGVAGVIGPGNIPSGVPRGVVTSGTAPAVRYALILGDQPLSSPAVDTLRRLRQAMPRLLRQADLAGASVSFGGNTALAEETIETVVRDLVRIGAAVIAVNLILLVLFLRALVAPLLLLAASVLALLATLGVTVYAFGLLGHDELTYFVPFMAAVLLVSLGSDYNIFLVGRVWQEARLRPLQEAIAVSVPRATRAISAAAVALALSFALLALVPISSFREFALAMFVGVLIDAFVVRTYLVPALLQLAGERSGWPGRLRPRARPRR
jgi:putative drug exporter of the RND superfamily